MAAHEDVKKALEHRVGGAISAMKRTMRSESQNQRMQARLRILKDKRARKLEEKRLQTSLEERFRKIQEDERVEKDVDKVGAGSRWVETALPLGEFMVREPESLWEFLVSPFLVGEVCLVVTGHGRTRVFGKDGRELVERCESSLPGGSRSSGGHESVLWGYLVEGGRIALVDVMRWRGVWMGFLNAAFRLRWMRDYLVDEGIGVAGGEWEFAGRMSNGYLLGWLPVYRVTERGLRMADEFDAGVEKRGLLFVHEQMQMIGGSNPLLLLWEDVQKEKLADLKSWTMTLQSNTENFLQSQEGIPIHPSPPDTPPNQSFSIRFEDINIDETSQYIECSNFEILHPLPPTTPPDPITHPILLKHILNDTAPTPESLSKAAIDPSSETLDEFFGPPLESIAELIAPPHPPSPPHKLPLKPPSKPSTSNSRGVAQYISRLHTKTSMDIDE